MVGQSGGVIYNTTWWGVEGIVLFFWRNNSWRCEREVECKRREHAWGCTPWRAWDGRRGREFRCWVGNK